MSENDDTSSERSEVTILEAADVERTVARIAHQIIEKTALDDPRSSDTPGVVLLGIPSGGAPLAQRLAAKIQEFTGVNVPTGSLDVTLYRDDLNNRPHRALEPTTIPVSIDRATVILVDDVLFSGRTVRSALDALRNIGRPARIQLAVLVDRGHRDLPIRADYVGKNLPTSADEAVEVQLSELDGEDSVFLVRGGLK